MLKISKSFKFAAAAVSSILTLAGLSAAPANAATAVINNVSFKAPVNTSYDHTTGGGVWNDGSVTWDKGELQGTDYKCGEWTSYLFELNANANPTMTGPYTATVTLTYTRDTTGQSGVSLNPSKDASHLKINSGVIYGQDHITTIGSRTGTGVNGWDSGANALGDQATVNAAGATITDNGKAEFVSGATQSITFTVSNIRAGANVVVRNDAQIHCKAGSSPTGNLQASLTSVAITGPSAESVSAGNQTVNFKNAGNILGASTPLLAVTKAISTDGSTCASTTPTATFQIGDPVLYCYTVYNYGSASAAGVTLVDDNATSGNTGDDVHIPLQYGSAAATTNGITIPGGGAYATGQYLTSYSAAGTFTNIATAVSTTTGATTPVTAQATVTVTAPTGPAIAITKSQTSAIRYYNTGDVISYSIRVTNTGATTLTSITVRDANADADPVCPFTSLISGASMTCTAEHTVQAGEVPTPGNTGYVDNVATVFTAELYSTGSPKQSNSVHTPTGAPVTHPSLSISKSQSSTARVTTTGDRIDYWITVTNTGDVDLTNVTISDANATIDSCSPSQSSTLAVGASMICAAHHDVTADDVTAAQVNNTADVRTAEVTGPTVSNLVTTPVGSSGLSIVKSQTSSNALHVAGDVVTYSIVVTNTGTTVLTNVSLTDANAVLDCGATTLPATLAIGASLTCSASHTVTSVDVTAGNVLNTAAVTTSELPGGTNSNTVVTPVTPVHVAVPNLSITKALNGAAPAKVGDVIIYSIVVTNIGETTLLGVTVVDANATVGACSLALPATLAVGDSVTCAATHVVTDADFAAGKVDNIASAVTTNTSLNPTSNLVTVPLNPAPAISVVKSVTNGTVAKTGDTISYKIVVTNTGNVTLNNVVVTDANAAIGACSVALPTTLAVGASFNCVATHVVTDADFAAGKVDNVAVASGTSAGGGSVNGSSGGNTNSNLVTVPLHSNPALSIVKAQVGALPTKLGGFIYYSINVTNTGNVNLHNVKVVDDNAIITGCSTANPNPMLAIGASFTCDAKHTLIDTDVSNGKVVNIAGASSDENATASSGASSGGSSGGTGSASGGSATPGSVNVPSNDVVTLIKIDGMRVKIKGVPNGGVVTLGITALQTPDIKNLAFTGDLDNIVEDASTFLAVMLVGAIAVLVRRRLARK